MLSPSDMAQQRYVKFKKPLPVFKKVVTNNLISSLLQDEQFDCLKVNIRKFKTEKFQGSSDEFYKVPFLDRNEFKIELQKRFPVKFAATIGKKRIRQFVKELPRWQRKIARRYFRRCRKVLFGGGRRTREERPLRFKYNEYIQSNVWSSRRNRFFKKFGRACTACGGFKKIHLHHMVYTKYDGNEPDAHLVALCEAHHNGYHKEYGVKKSMITTTIEYINRIKNETK